MVVDVYFCCQFFVDISMCLAGWKLTLRGFVVIIIIVMIILLIVFRSFEHSYFGSNTGRQNYQANMGKDSVLIESLQKKLLQGSSSTSIHK